MYVCLTFTPNVFFCTVPLIHLKTSKSVKPFSSIKTFDGDIRGKARSITMAGLVSVPNVDINFVPVKGGETFKLGPLTCRVMEDGSHTGTPLPFPTTISQ